MSRNDILEYLQGHSITWYSADLVTTDTDSLEELVAEGLVLTCRAKDAPIEHGVVTRSDDSTQPVFKIATAS